MSRETRLLLATIVISGVVVLALSTLRFPDTPRLTEAPPAPLERLAASAAYDQLARIVDRVARRVRPDLLVVRSNPVAIDQPRGLADLLTQPITAEIARHYPALRIDNERAVLAVDMPKAAVVLLGGTTMDAGILGVDPLRQITVLAVPPADATSVTPVTLSELQTPTYVVVAEGTAAGIAFRPVFVGSADRFADSRWQRPLLAVSGTALTSAGALVFSLEGQFIGAAVVPQSGEFAVAGAAELLAAASDLIALGAAPPRDFGIRVQEVTEANARVLGASQGVVVVSVEPDSPAAGILEPLDVITTAANVPVRRPEDLLLRLARNPRENTWQIRGLRNGEPAEWTLTFDGREAAAPPAESLRFERVGNGSIVRTVPKKSAAARAGLREGDLIVRVGAIVAPTPAQLMPLLRDDNGAGAVLIVRRDGEDRMLTVQGPPTPQ